MEFHYHRLGHAPDLSSIERAIAELDPAVLLDLDASGRIVRISTTLGDHDLIDCLRRAGAQVVAEDLERLPSVCCGGCSG